MTLIDQIEEWIFEYEGRTGRKPIAVRVPEWRMPEIVAEARRFAKGISDEPIDNVVEIAGVKLETTTTDFIELISTKPARKRKDRRNL